MIRTILLTALVILVPNLIMVSAAIVIIVIMEDCVYGHNRDE